MVETLTPHLPNLLWWVPLLPLIAGGIIALLPDKHGRIPIWLLRIIMQMN